MGNFSIKEDLLKLKGAFMTAGFMSGKKAFI